MAVNTNKTQEKSGVKLPVMILAAVAVVIVIGWLGHRAFAPVANVSTSATKVHDAFIAKIVKEAGPTADITKLTPDDRAAFEKQYVGAPISAEDALKSLVKGSGGK